MRTRLVGAAVAMLVLALGVALGAGPLQGDNDRFRRDAARQEAAVAARDAEIQHLSDATTLASAYTAATSSRLLAGRLANRKVAVITLPGSDPETVTALVGLMTGAGAQVTARVALSAALFDPNSQGLVDALSSQMVEQSTGVVAAATGYARIGALLARAIGVPASAQLTSAPYDPVAISIVAGLKAAKLVDSAEVSARAGLTVVVLPGTTEAAAVHPAISIVAGYAGQFPTVVAGPATAAGPGQVLTVLRDGDAASASTVDSLESSVGRVITVLALAARARGAVGDFGAVGAVDAAVPPDS